MFLAFGLYGSGNYDLINFNYMSIRIRIRIRMTTNTNTNTNTTASTSICIRIRIQDKKNAKATLEKIGLKKELLKKTSAGQFS